MSHSGAFVNDDSTLRLEVFNHWRRVVSRCLEYLDTLKVGPGVSER